jgi:hypothetical protein
MYEYGSTLVLVPQRKYYDRHIRSSSICCADRTKKYRNVDENVERSNRRMLIKKTPDTERGSILEQI